MSKIPHFVEEVVMKNIPFSIIVIIALFATLVFAEEENYPAMNKDTSGYDLQELINIALQNNPTVTALKFELQAADARIIQSGLWPNPEFSAETENFSGDLPGFNYTENTFSVTQPLLLGGKINLQRKLSEQELLILKYEYEAEKIALITEIEHAVYHILLTQKNLEYAMEARDTARTLFDFTKGKTKEEERADVSHEILSLQIELSQSEVEIVTVERNLEIAKESLSLLCGNPDISQGHIKGDLDRKFDVLEFKALKECILKNNFKVKAAEESENRAEIRLNIANADKIPDVDLGFGVRQFEEDNSYTFVAGLSVPLPLFDRNQGSIQEAQINKNKVEFDKKSLVNELSLLLNEFYGEYQTSLQLVTTYKNSILPSAQEYYDITVDKYEKGTLQYLDVLIAKRTLIQIKKQYTESLHTLQNSVANIENICSRHFHGPNADMF